MKFAEIKFPNSTETNLMHEISALTFKTTAPPVE